MKNVKKKRKSSAIGNILEDSVAEIEKGAPEVRRASLRSRRARREKKVALQRNRYKLFYRRTVVLRGALEFSTFTTDSLHFFRNGGRG